MHEKANLGKRKTINNDETIYYNNVQVDYLD